MVADIASHQALNQSRAEQRDDNGPHRSVKRRVINGVCSPHLSNTRYSSSWILANCHPEDFFHRSLSKPPPENWGGTVG
jgi:hypothetical protein